VEVAATTVKHGTETKSKEYEATGVQKYIIFIHEARKFKKDKDSPPEIRYYQLHAGSGK